MSPRWVAPLLLALLALPGVAHGHAGEDHSGDPAAADEATRPSEVALPEGYTGPGREPYLSYFEGNWLYGQMIATPIGQQLPRSLDVDGDWVVWEDGARSDIFAYSISASQGFYVTSDAATQRNPRVSDNVVVYEDYAAFNRPVIMAYFLDTGEMRRLSNSTTVVRDPAIEYPLVAWVDENATNPDIWAYSLLNQTSWNLNPSTDRDGDPLVVGDAVYWRTYRYGLWDLVGHDTGTGVTTEITADTAIQTSPFTNGEDVFFLTHHLQTGWRVDRYDERVETVRKTNILLPDARRVSASGDGMLSVVQDLDFSELVVRNLSSGATNHVSGDLILVGEPVLQERTVFAPVRTKIGTSLLVLEVSPFALAKPPSLTITSPGQNFPWTRPIVVSGILEAGGGFAEPTTFTYRVEDGPPQIIPAANRWRVTLDPTGVEPGLHVLTVRATFREGPPVTTTLTLLVPDPGTTVDVARAGPAFHAARVAGELDAYVLSNPASWFLIPLVLVLLVLVIVRLRLGAKPKRGPRLAEYVPPEEW